MKVFISVDIEGVAGISCWDEADHEHLRGAYYAEQMTKEAAAAARAAVDLGAKVIVKDAHESARNMDVSQFPKSVRFLRGWTGSPMSMMDGFDDSFDAVIFIGYHSGAYTLDNPLAHTMSNSRFQKITLNGEIISEFILNSLMSYYHGVPVVFISGDAGICEQAILFEPNLEYVATQEGIGDATLSIHPDLSVDLIYENVKKALTKPLTNYQVKLPKQFEITIEYKNLKDYYKASFYPGVYAVDDRTLGFKHSDFYEVARAVAFMK